MDFTRRVTDAYAIPHEAPIRDVGVASSVRLLRRDGVPSSAQHCSLKLYVILVFLVNILPAHAQSGGDARAPSPTHPQLRQPTGADRCLFCHAAEVQGYSRTGMAHALRRAGQEPDGVVSRNGTKITIHSSATGSSGWRRCTPVGCIAIGTCPECSKSRGRAEWRQFR